MIFKDIKLRYPFAIADDKGDVLFDFPKRTFPGESIFGSGLLSYESYAFLRDIMDTGSYSRPIAVKAQNGDLLVYLLSIFPSTRTVAAVKTDIKYSDALPVIIHSLPQFVFSSDTEMSGAFRYTKKRLGIYSELAKILSDLGIAFGDKSEGYGFTENLMKRTELISFMCGSKCETEIMLTHNFDACDFDSGLCTLFLFSAFMSASEYSEGRCCRLQISEASGHVRLRVLFDIPYSAKNAYEYDIPSSPLVLHIRRLCENYNIPFSFICNGYCAFEIIAARPDISLIGLKVPHPFLKHKEYKEQHQCTGVNGGILSEKEEYQRS